MDDSRPIQILLKTPGKYSEWLAYGEMLST